MLTFIGDHGRPPRSIVTMPFGSPVALSRWKKSRNAVPAGSAPRLAMNNSPPYLAATIRRERQTLQVYASVWLAKRAVRLPGGELGKTYRDLQWRLQCAMDDLGALAVD